MMRALGVGSMLLLCVACDNKEDAKPAPAASSTITGTVPTATATTTAASSSASAAPAASVAMPERPVPKGTSMVSASAPIEQQQKAITYMAAMRAPHADDAAADATYAADLVNKLKPIVMGMDTGGDKARMNRVDVIAGGRQIDMLMSAGCNEGAPKNAVVQRAGVSLPTLVSHGVLVVRCNDARIQCLQSTRDPDDVLCTTAPRHK